MKQLSSAAAAAAAAAAGAEAEPEWLLRLAAARQLHAESVVRNALMVLEAAGIAHTVVHRPNLVEVKLQKPGSPDAVLRVPSSTLDHAARELRAAGWRERASWFARWRRNGQRATRFDREAIVIELISDAYAPPPVDANRPEPQLRHRYRALRELLRGRSYRFSFMDLDLKVDPGVFKPGHWSANVVQAVWWEVEGIAKPLIIDVGTGTGALAIAMAAGRGDAQVLGIDISGAAVRNARRNARRLHVHNARFLKGAMLDVVPADWRERVHVIVANLPWIPGTVCAHAQLTGVEWRGPEWSIHGEGNDGLDLQRTLARSSWPLLRPGGALVMEVDHWQSARLVPELQALAYDASTPMPGLVIARKPAVQ
ncbi:MAG: methyltransferase domain-containing protein [Longimicrobiales bacterium]